MSVYLIGVFHAHICTLNVVHLTGAHLTGVHLAYGRVSHGRAPHGCASHGRIYYGPDGLGTTPLPTPPRAKTLSRFRHCKASICTVPRFEHDIIFIRLECIQAKGVSCGVYASRVYLYPYSWLPVRNVDERGSSTRVIWVQEILPTGAPMPSSDEGFVSFPIIPNEMNNH